MFYHQREFRIFVPIWIVNALFPRCHIKWGFNTDNSRTTTYLNCQVFQNSRLLCDSVRGSFVIIFNCFERKIAILQTDDLHQYTQTQIYYCFCIDKIIIFLKIENLAILIDFRKHLIRILNASLFLQKSGFNCSSL